MESAGFRFEGMVNVRPFEVASPKFAQSGSEAIVEAAPVLWMTGLSGSGKTTIAKILAKIVRRAGTACCILDGDELRQGLNKDLSFSDSDRTENVRRVAEVAKSLGSQGILAIVCLISPFHCHRSLARAIIGTGFAEIFVDTPLAVCIERDQKGLYAKAIRGEIDSFTGISSRFDVPDSSQLTLQTTDKTALELAYEIYNKFVAPSITDHP